MRRLPGIIPLVALVIVSCSERRTTEVTAPTPVKTIPKVPDVIDNGDGIVARYFAPDNPYTDATLRTAMLDVNGLAAVEHFERAGYELRRDASFVVDGENKEGRTVELSIVAMANTNPSANTGVTLVCIHRDEGGHLVQPLKIRFPAPELQIGPPEEMPPVSIEPLEPVVAHASVGAPPPSELNWRRFGGCVAAGTVASAVRCLYQCIVTGPAYLQCLASCGGLGVVSAIAGCALIEAIWSEGGSNNDKDDQSLRGVSGRDRRR
jgi:hypothetical protein